MPKRKVSDRVPGGGTRQLTLDSFVTRIPATPTTNDNSVDITHGHYPEIVLSEIEDQTIGRSGGKVHPHPTAVSRSHPEIKLVQLNLDHTKLAFDNLIHYLKSRNLDVALLQDVQCRGSSLILPSISGYVGLGNPNVSVYIKNGLVHRLLVQSNRYIIVEILGVKLVNVYLSPNQPYDGVLDQLSHELTAYRDLVLVGDLNCHLPEVERRHKYTKRDYDIAEWLEQHKLALCNTTNTPTWSRRSWLQSGTLDYTCVKNVPVKRWYVDNKECSYAEHFYIRFSILLENMEHEALTAAAPPSYITDKDELNVLFGTHKDRVYPTCYSEVDQAATDLSHWVVECINQCTQVREWRPAGIYWWSPQLSTMKRAINSINWKILKSKDSFKKEIYVLLSKELRRIYRNMIKSSKEDNWRQFISVGRAWGKPYKFIVKSKKYVPVPAVITRDDGTKSTNYEDTKRSLLNDKFPESDPFEKVLFEGFKLTLRPSEDWQPTVPLQEIREYIKFRNNLSSPGLDKVRWSHVKLLFRNLEEYFYYLLVSIVRYASFPGCWKEAESVFIPKEGKESHEKTGDFRPLSKLSCLGKVAESFIAREINRFLENETPLLDDCQFGFRKGITAEHALMLVTSKIFEIIKSGRIGACISIDIKGAFDHMSHFSVVSSMREKGLCENLVAVIADYLSGRSCSYGGVTRHLDRGCPQGSVLGPLLWNISYDSVLKMLRDKGLFFSCFADDTIIIVEDHDPIQLKNKIKEVVMLLNEKLLDITLLLNKKKTNIMIINDKRLSWEDREQLKSVNIGEGISVDTVPYFKYLGIMLDRGLTFSEHFNYLSYKTNKIVNRLRLICPNIDGYSNKARKIMYEGTVGAIWKYGSVVFAHRLQLKKNARIARKIHRRVLIACLRAYRTCRYLSLTLLAAWVPFEMEILGRAILAGQRYGWRVDTRPFSIPAEDIHLLSKEELRDRIRKCMLSAWEREWSTVPLDSWTKRLFPTVRSALDAPLYPDFYLMQALTGHGVVREYTHKVNKEVVRDPLCPTCFDVESIEHVLLYCPRFQVDRPYGGIKVNHEWIKYAKTTVKKLWEIENGVRRREASSTHSHS